MKIGVLGMGSIGRRHAFNLEKLGHEVHGYDTAWKDNGERRLNEVLEVAAAFVIASPIETHARYLEQLNPLNKPIFCEKPLTDTGEAMINNVKMVGYNLRFHSCVLKAKGWIEAGHLGTAQWANFVCGQLNRKYKEHVILNWSHEIDLALYLLGPGQLQNCAADINGTIADLTIWHYPCHTTIHLDYLTEPWIRQAIIVGNKATIIMDLERRFAWLRDASGTILDQHQGQDDFDDNYVDEMETFIARCEGNKDTAGATAEDGLAVTKICLDAIERSNHAKEDQHS